MFTRKSAAAALAHLPDLAEDDEGNRYTGTSTYGQMGEGTGPLAIVWPVRRYDDDDSDEIVWVCDEGMLYVDEVFRRKGALLDDRGVVMEPNDGDGV